MPWQAFKEGDEWCVYKLTGEGGDKTGSSLGCHPTKGEADDQVAALYASEERAMDDRALGLFQQFWNGLRGLFKLRAWDGSASNYADTDAYCSACLIDVNSAAGRDTKAQSHCKLPAKSPGSDSYDFEGIQAAANAISGGRGGMTKPDDVSEEDWNAAVKKAANTIISQYNANDETAPDGVYEAAGKTPPERQRAMSMPRLYEAIYESLWSEEMSVGYLVDCYVDDDGSLYALTTRDGKLYRHMLSIQNDEITLGEAVQVMETHPPVATRTQIRQQSDGKWRWFSVSATSVLNRSGEIDSRALFDSFVAHAEETGEYPIRQFYHQGEVFRTGQADFLARDGYCYVTSGLFDDTPLAQAEIAARNADPDYWGESIGFLPRTEPELFEVAPGIRIPVYIAGINRDISTLPESDAASLMTVTRQEVIRMMNDKQHAAFIKLWTDAGYEDPEEAARQWLEAHPEARNRTIEEAGMIVRETEEEPPAETEEQPAEETQPEQARAVTIDDEAIQAIVDALGKAQLFQALVARMEEVATAGEATRTTGEALQAGLTELRDGVTALETRIKALEADDADKQRRWMEDLPAAATQPSLVVSYRPREHSNQPEEEVPPTYADRAAAARDGLQAY